MGGERCIGMHVDTQSRKISAYAERSVCFCMSYLCAWHTSIMIDCLRPKMHKFSCGCGGLADTRGLKCDHLGIYWTEADRSRTVQRYPGHPACSQYVYWEQACMGCTDKNASTHIYLEDHLWGVTFVRHTSRLNLNGVYIYASVLTSVNMQMSVLGWQCYSAH